MRAQLHCFSEGNRGIECYPLLALELRGYALIPVVCRRVESAHAEWKGITKKVTAARFPFKAASMRRADIENQLDKNDSFMQFLVDNWRKRSVLQNALK